MRIVLLFFVAIFVLCGDVLADSQLKYQDVTRGLIWGIGIQDVEQFESARLLKKEEGMLFYSTKLYERQSTIGYQFIDNALSRIRIDIHERTANSQEWITSLMDIEKDLTEKWGKPVSEEFIWHDELEKDFPNNWGFAVLRGDLEIIIKWSDTKTRVTAMLKSSRRLEPVITIIYEPIVQEQNTINLDESSAEQEMLPLLLP